MFWQSMAAATTACVVPEAQAIFCRGNFTRRDPRRQVTEFVPQRCSRVRRGILGRGPRQRQLSEPGNEANNERGERGDNRSRPCCVEENKMSYHIEINEYQRRLIMKALTSTDVNQFSQAPGSGDAFDTEAKEFVCLVQMFGTLDLDDTAPGAEALFRVQM